MKHLRILMGIALLALWITGCQNSVDQVQPEQSPKVEDASNVSRYQITHTTEQADRLLYSKHGSLDFSEEEKLKLMTDLVAENYFSNDGAARTDQYVFVAQIFILGVYYTDVAVFNGTLTSNFSGARVNRSDSGSGGVIGFVGANANVYLNGNNIQGKITFEPNLDCSDWYLESDCEAQARWFASSGAFTSVFIECFID